jgi:hypothetical protein
MKNKQTIKYLYASILFLSLLLGFYSVYLYGVANHNIDLGQNLMKINVISGQNLIDVNSEGNEWTGLDMYIEGGSQLNKSYFLLAFSVFLIGFSLKGVMEDGDRY